MAEHWIVVGGGFKGMVGAHLLASKGLKVTLVEPAKVLGSVLRSVPWKGFYLDKGCHLFCHDDEISSSIVLSILEDDYEPVNVKYASIFRGSKSEDTALVDMSVCGPETVRKILFEMTVCAARKVPIQKNLDQEFRVRYGDTAADLLNGPVYKTYQVDATELDANSLLLTQFERIGLLPKEAAELLKRLPEFDERLAMPSPENPMRFVPELSDKYDYRFFYPKQRGLLGLCEKFETLLRNHGVSIQLGQAVEKLQVENEKVRIKLSDDTVLESDRVLWAAGPELYSQLAGLEESIDKYVLGVPMVLYYFVIKKEQEKGYTYIQDFDRESLVYRASFPCSYVQNASAPPGLSYVCCEVPTKIDSPQWKSPKDYADAVWQELQKQGVVGDGQPQDLLAVTVPVTYKVPRPGYWDVLDRIAEPLREHKRILGLDQWELSMNDITRTLQETIEAL